MKHTDKNKNIGLTQCRQCLKKQMKQDNNYNYNYNKNEIDELQYKYSYHYFNFSVFILNDY